MTVIRPSDEKVIPERYCSGCHPYGWPNGPMPHEPWCTAAPVIRPSKSNDVEHLMLALVQLEGVLNECEALLRQALDEDGVNTDFAQRLYDYWKKSDALADWRTRDLVNSCEIERLRAALAPFVAKGETSIQDIYNARKALGLDPYDDAGAAALKASTHETLALPHASAALKAFMSELGEIMSMEDGATPADYLQRARDIREWCHDHQTPPAQKASESRVAYNSNGDAYLAEPPPSSEPEQR